MPENGPSIEDYEKTKTTEKKSFNARSEQYRQNDAFLMLYAIDLPDWQDHFAPYTDAIDAANERLENCIR